MLINPIIISYIHPFSIFFQCDLYKAGLKEKMVLHTDTQQGNVVGVDYSPSHGLMSRMRSCQADKLNLPNGNVPIGTTVKVSPAVPAEVIPVQAVGQSPPGIKIANPNEKENPQQHQSFFIKYVSGEEMVVIFVVSGIVVMIHRYDDSSLLVASR